MQGKNEHGEKQARIQGAPSGVTLGEFLRLVQYQYLVGTELGQC